MLAGRHGGPVGRNGSDPYAPPDRGGRQRRTFQAAAAGLLPGLVLPALDPHRDLLAPDFVDLGRDVLKCAIQTFVLRLGGRTILVDTGIGEHEDRPAWMGRVGFSDLKIKLMGAIVAILAVELLKAFINVDENTPWQTLAWKVGIHVTFVVSGVLFAVTDRITDRGGH